MAYSPCTSNKVSGSTSPRSIDVRIWRSLKSASRCGANSSSSDGDSARPPSLRSISPMVCGDRVVAVISPPSASDWEILGHWRCLPGRDNDSCEQLKHSIEDVRYPIYYIKNYQVKLFFIFIDTNNH